MIAREIEKPNNILSRTSSCKGKDFSEKPIKRRLDRSKTAMGKSSAYIKSVSKSKPMTPSHSQLAKLSSEDEKSS